MADHGNDDGDVDDDDNVGECVRIDTQKDEQASVEAVLNIR